ncbi:RNA recognition motif domain containing protein [Hondaea fermentalgiana]|uniref:RNA recognition motif domain containing protein n=1 Tax=Hondaea fermentalgiana TaxID=2315210 RepID=A0A2R5GTN8_9STRA|nr:RNA recognition motif domain containing protein [Hondaea fermentalgiana]|eukprot:GBG33118.1 RNA recognition motif domain containing protein [Hondaea fermentalgiana]
MSANDLEALLDYEEDEDEEQQQQERQPQQQQQQQQQEQQQQQREEPKLEAPAAAPASAQASASAARGEEGAGAGAGADAGAALRAKLLAKKQRAEEAEAKHTSSSSSLAGLADAVANARKRAAEKGDARADAGGEQHADRADADENKPLPAVAVMASAARARAAKAASATLYVTHIPREQSEEEKLRSHFARYGAVSKIDFLTEDSCLIVFENVGSAGKAFVNRAPVFKNPAIRVFRVPDHEVADRAKALASAVASPNRKVVAASKPSEGTAGMKKAGETSGADAGQKAAASSEARTAVDEDDLYGNISMSGGPAESGNLAGSNSAADAAGSGRRPEKRTWSRAGLANMNDPGVIRAKIKEKQAMKQLGAAREQVTTLMQDLDKQKQQFKMMGTDAKTIGKGLRAELMSNISLLMAQLRHAKASIENAKAGVTRAKKDVETAVEASKAGSS